jgi:Leucine-rich repeat (LRR) protein
MRACTKVDTEVVMAEKRGFPGMSRMLLLLSLPLSGCSISPYTVSLNNNVLYSPNSELQAAGVTDAALQGCINQALAVGPTEITALKTLACPNAGVRSLEGITRLTALEQLELSNNDIDNLSPLQPLRNLRVVSLRNNDIRNIGPLSGLALLRFVSLEGNEAIPCIQLDELQERLGNTLNRPIDCSN